MFRKKDHFSSCGTLLFILLISLAVGDLIAFFVLPARIFFPTEFKTPPQQIRIAAILFGGFNPTYTGLNRETKRRVNHGIEMLEHNQVEYLVVVGGNRDEIETSGAQLMADYLLESGVTREEILLENKSSDSLSNLEQLNGILAKEKVHSAILISSPYHLMRIKRIKPRQDPEFMYSPYDPAHISPSPTRKEIWRSIHYNLAAYFTHVLLPESVYRTFVNWVRKNTEW